MIIDPERDIEPDAAVVERVLAGERDAFAEIVRAYQHRVYTMIFRAVGDEHTASELAQETFLRAYKHLASYRGSSSLSTWLIRIALNRTNSYFRSRRFKEAKQSVSLEELDLELRNHDEEGAGLERKLAAVRSAVGSLKPTYRDPLMLYCYEGKSYRAIAEILEIPIGTVGSRISAAIQMLKKQLKESADG